MQKVHTCKKEPGGRNEATMGSCQPQLLEGRNQVEDTGQETEKKENVRQNKADIKASHRTERQTTGQSDGPLGVLLFSVNFLILA